MSDLIERLRMGRAAPDNSHYLMQRAADEIERLTTELFKCRESRLAETMRDLPEWKADKDRIEKLEGELKAWKPDFAYEGKACPGCGRKYEAIAEVDDKD